MNYSIAINILPVDAQFYVFPDETNPTEIESGTEAVLNFNADGVFYTFSKATIDVSGADKAS